MEFMRSSLAFLKGAEQADKWDPPSLFRAVGTDVKELTVGLAKQFGSAGKAW
jgi:fructose-bisphosphate aldolase class II